MTVATAGSKFSSQYPKLPLLLLACVLPACDAETSAQAGDGMPDAVANRPNDSGNPGEMGRQAKDFGPRDANPRVDVATPDASRNPARPECGDESLTQWEQKMLEAHNRWRGSVQPTAAKMYRVYWDTNIARNAAEWVSSCDPAWPHSPDENRRNIGGYDVLGENLSFCAGSGCAPDPNITDESGKGDGEGWWNERNDYQWSDDTSTGITAHYTLMVSSNVYAIGCATQRCDPPGPSNWDGEWWWTICQYGPRGQAYWVGTKPYDAGEGGLIEPPDTVFDEHCLHR